MAIIGASNSWGMTSGIPNGTYPVSARLSLQQVLWAAALGLTRYRFQYSAQGVWRNQSDPPSVWDYSVLDDAFYKLQLVGFYIIYTIQLGSETGNLSWGFTNVTQKSSTLPWFLPDPATMLTYATAILARYDGVFNVPGYGPIKIHCIEIFNEEGNNHHEVPGSGVQGIRTSPFAEYNSAGINVVAGVEPDRDPFFMWNAITSIVPTLKIQRPDIVIGMGAIWWMWDLNFSDFITGLGPTNGLQNALGMVAYMNCHLYTNSNDPLTGGGGHVPSISTALTNMRTSCTALGFSQVQMPIHITEFGWQVPTDCDSPTQAIRYDELLSYCIGRGDITEIDFYTIDDKTVAPDQSSLITWSASLGKYVISPAYYVVQQAIAAHPNIGRG